VSARRPAPAHARVLAAALALLAGAGAGTTALAGCGDTLQDQPIAHNALETMLVAPYPVYWAGRSFAGLQITEASHDAGGAFDVHYGDCVVGGQSTCVPPLRIVSSPDNSFVPAGATPRRSARVRGVQALVAQRGATIEIATGPVVVDIYADSARLAAAAAQTIVPINELGAPGQALPARLPDSCFASTPLPSQVPSPLRALR
jgi:hypothetical protein